MTRDTFKAKGTPAVQQPPSASVGVEDVVMAARNAENTIRNCAAAGQIGEGYVQYADDLRDAVQRLAQQPAASRVRCGDERYELDAYLWRRESTQEWVLELSGTINDTGFVNRFPVPLSYAPEDAVSLPNYDQQPEARGVVDVGLSLADLCRLSGVFDDHSEPHLPRDRHIKEWLGKRIAEALAQQPAVVGTKPLSEFMAEQEVLHPGIRDKVQAEADELRASLAQQPAAARVDVRGLVALAEQMERDAAGCRRDGYIDAAVVKEDCAYRIRQTLGISAIAEAVVVDA